MHLFKTFLVTICETELVTMAERVIWLVFSVFENFQTQTSILNEIVYTATEIHKVVKLCHSINFKIPLHFHA